MIIRKGKRATEQKQSFSKPDLKPSTRFLQSDILFTVWLLKNENKGVLVGPSMI